ncbi:MAG TPA: OstA-like protein [Chitinophagaceae bacterium]|nr:OstA-like protein [Chitinophagaceae bacterium]
MHTRMKIVGLVILLNISFYSYSQIIPPSNTDTIKEFEIIRGPSMRTIRIDSLTTLQTIAGGAIIKQETTLFTSDSATINPTTHIVEAFGNVHINQADSVQTYADYLKYVGTEKTAYLKKNVKLTDKKGTLFTQDLDYNLNTGIGNYHNGGKVINRDNTITSREGTYYADTKDVYFRNNVDVVGPKNRIKADSLIYNMRSEVVAFTGNTNIRNKEVDIVTTQGTYDLKTGNAFFTSRTSVKDSSGRIYIANNMALDDKSGNAQLEGNAIVKDSANGFIVTGNQIFLNKKNNSFLATRKPVMIIKQKDDSTYIAADTLFSGVKSFIDNNELIIKKDSAVKDSLHLNIGIDSSKALSSRDSLSNFKPFNLNDSSRNIMHMIDSLKLHRRDVIKSPVINPSENPGLVDSPKAISPTKNFLPHDSSSNDSMQKASTLSIGDSIKVEKKILNDSVNASDSAVRYFLAFHHVKIFNDSLQSICDSLFFSAKDSVFRLFYDPVVWSGRSQINGDTIFLYTKNEKPQRLYVFEKGLIVNKTTQGFYNQITGKTINGYFVDGKIDYMRVKGSQSESIYYAQDDDSAYIGMNRATGDVIDLYFKDDDLIKVLFVNDVKGKMYPMRKIPEEEKKLKNFIWLDDKRPKNRLELFE